MLARCTTSVSFPVRVDSVETPYVGCLWTIGYFVYEPQRVLVRMIHGIGLDARTIQYDALRFDRLRQLYFRYTARVVTVLSMYD